MISVVESKAPLLPIESRNTPTTTVQPQMQRSENNVRAWISRFITVCTLVWSLYHLYHMIPASMQGVHVGDEPEEHCHLGQGLTHHDKSLNYTKRELLHFDIDSPAYWPISPSVSITESLNICHYSYSWNASGRVRLVTGDPGQQYNFMIGMQTSGSSQQAIDSVVWPIYSERNGMYIRCVEFPNMDDTSADWDATIVLDVTVFVKPHTLQFGEFKVGTDVLDIEIAKDLTFETYHMQLFSTRGNIHGNETVDFTAHEISAHSQNGSITGNWSLPGKIELTTGGWNSLDKPIDIDLIPKMWSSGPSTQGVILASTTGGDIDIRMPLDHNLSLRNMSINVHSQVGSIRGSLVTGFDTTLTTLSGSIDVTLLPYFALPDTSTLVTSTAAGHTNILVLPPIIDSYYQVNPLTNIKSEHSTTSGKMRLSYPPQWAGAALGLTETGAVGIEGDRFNMILQEEHLVVARTDDEIASRLDFSTTTGDGHLVVE